MTTVTGFTMYRFLALLFVVCLLALVFVPDTSYPVVAQDEDSPESKATDRRPINDQMTLSEAREAIEKAVDGDDDALQRLKDGRLAYLPVMLRDNRAFQLAHSLMRDDIGWMRDMQRWEVVLSRFDTTDIAETYHELEDRFVHAEGQLARAYIVSHRLGDIVTAGKLAKHAKDSEWILAARAWVGDIEDPARRVKLLLDILEPQIELSWWSIIISPGLLDDEVSQYRYGTGDFGRAEIQLYYGADGVADLRSIPAEWLRGNYFEQLGVLTHDLPREEREEVANAVAEVTDGPEGTRYDSFYYAAFHGEPEAKWEVNFAWTHYAHVTPVLGYADGMFEDEPLPRRVSAMVGFWGAPHWGPGQQRLLKEGALSADATFANLCARAVLCVNDGRLRAINSVARMLREYDILNKERDAFRKALKATGNDQLAEVADYLGGSGKLPDDMGNPKHGLSVAQKASLLMAFMHADEVASYGGEEAAYLMNISQFQFSRHAVYAGTEFALRAISAAAKKLKRKAGLTSAYLLHRTLRRFIGPGRVEDWAGTWRHSHADAVKILNRHVELWNNPGKGVESAVYVVERQVNGGEEASEKQLETLHNDPSYAGGYGMNLFNYLPESVVHREDKLALIARAERCTPTDFNIYYQSLPYSDWFGRYTFRDWTLAEHYTQCVCLLQPWDWSALVKLGGLLAKKGCDPRCMSGYIAQATDVPTQPYLGGNTPNGLNLMLFNRFAVANLLKKNAHANGNRMPEVMKEVYTRALERTAWGLDWRQSMSWGPLLSYRGAFTDACFDFEFNARDRSNVSILLNFALELQGVSPNRAIRLVELSEEIGISPYGRFVGAQSVIRAKAQLGDYDEAIKLWDELRGGNVGFPPYLDFMLLHGLLEGNQWQDIPNALSKIREYDPDVEGVYMPFAMRRAMMAAGRYGQVGKLPEPNWVPRSSDSYNIGNYTSVFYEARRLLEDGRMEELHERAVQMWTSGAEVSIGVILDAILLRCVAGKLNPATTGRYVPDDEGLLHILSRDDLLWFRPSETLDYVTLQIMAGERDPDDLPEIGDVTWHGMRYAERPQQYKGSGFLRPREAEARDCFIRGLIAYFADNKKEARKQLRKCMDKDQRCSHEYHVAEWLLENQLKE